MRRKSFKHVVSLVLTISFVFGMNGIYYFADESELSSEAVIEGTSETNQGNNNQTDDEETQENGIIVNDVSENIVALNSMLDTVDTITVSNLDGLNTALADSNITKIIIDGEIKLDGVIRITKELTISGLSEQDVGVLKLEDSVSSRHFEINANGKLHLENIKLEGHGGTTIGGGIRLYGNPSALEGNNLTVTNCRYGGNGGGISAEYGSVVTLVNSEISNNHVYANSGDTMGGGISADNSAIVKIENSKIINNVVNGTSGKMMFGGGIGVYTAAEITITGGSVISGNETKMGNENGGFGGGIGVFSGLSNVQANINVNIGGDSIINDNTAENGGGIGTLLYRGSISFDIENVTFNNNTAISGGGIYNTGAKFDIVGCIIENNKALTELTGSIGKGGGIYISGGEVNIANTDIILNRAGNDECTEGSNNGGFGGGIYINSLINPTGLNFINSNTISENSAVTHGGGIYVGKNITTNIANVTISGNRAMDGCGVYLDEGSTGNIESSVTITNNETNNEIVGQGGGVHIHGATANIYSKIIGNKAPKGGGVCVSSENTNVGAVANIKSDAVISGNKTTAQNHEGQGGGIYINGGTANIEGSVISNESELGGGIYVGTFNLGSLHDGNSKVDIKDGAVISGNKAKVTSIGEAGNGGGIYVEKLSQATIEGGTISNNNADKCGGGIYTEDYNKLGVSTGAKFSDNYAGIGPRYVIFKDEDNTAHTNNILTRNFTVPKDFPVFEIGYNNYDINSPNLAVTFDYNDGTNRKTITEIEGSGDYCQKPADPTRNGYNFEGWRLDSASGRLWVFDDDTVQHNTTLVAKWTARPVEAPDIEIETEADSIEVEVLVRNNYTGTPSDPDILRAENFMTGDTVNIAALKTAFSVYAKLNGSNIGADNVKVDVSKINFGDISGTGYDVVFTVSERDLVSEVSSDNLTVTKTVKVIVKDTTPPTVTPVENHVPQFSINTTMTERLILDSFANSTKSDNYYADNGITLKVVNANGGAEDFTRFNERPGIYGIYLMAEDGSGNVSRVPVPARIEMITGRPVITALTSITYTVGNSRTQPQFKTDINAAVTDSFYKDMNVDDIRIEDFGNINFNRIGTYGVTLTATNNDGQEATPVSVTVNIVSGGGGGGGDTDSTPNPGTDTTTDETITGGGEGEAPVQITEGEEATIPLGTGNVRAVRLADDEDGLEVYEIFDEDGTPLGTVKVPAGKTLEEVLLEKEITPLGIKTNPPTGTAGILWILPIMLVTVAAAILLISKRKA